MDHYVTVPHYEPAIYYHEAESSAYALFQLLN